MELLKCLNNELKLPLANATSSREIASAKRVQPSRRAGCWERSCRQRPALRTAPPGARGCTEPPQRHPDAASRPARGAGWLLCRRLCLSELSALAGDLRAPGARRRLLVAERRARLRFLAGVRNPPSVCSSYFEGRLGCAVLLKAVSLLSGRCPSLCRPGSAPCQLRHAGGARAGTSAVLLRDRDGSTVSAPGKVSS